MTLNDHTSKRKHCKCKVESAWYYDVGVYKCQYCSGLLTDLKRVRKIIEGNTSVNQQNREDHIAKELKNYTNYL